MATFLGLRLFNEATSLSIFALNLAIGLGLGLAIDYSLFVLSRYREEMERDGPGRAALTRTLRTAGRTVIFSSLTVAAAMLSLLVFPQRFLYSMAISGSITALAAGFIALTALPALLMVLGPRVDAFAPQRWRHREIDPQHGFWYRLSHLVMRRPVAVALTTAAVLIAAGLPVHADRVHRRRRQRAARQLRGQAGRHGAAHGVSARPRLAAARRRQRGAGRARRAGRLRPAAGVTRRRRPPSTHRASSATASGSSRSCPPRRRSTRAASSSSNRCAPVRRRGRCASPASRRASSTSAPGSATACRRRSPCWRSPRC